MSVWDKRITKAEKFFDKARSHGRNVYDRYADERSDVLVGGIKRANIFYANVNTIKESLFNSLPKPSVSRIHKGDYEDDVARVAALILQRALSYEIICAKSFQEAIKYAILDRLVPGIGQVWVRFEKPEQLFVDVVYWEDFLYEPARSWDLVTWVARIHELDKKAFIEAYGQKGFDQAEEVLSDSSITPKEITDGKYRVYEIWDKKQRKVFHVVKGAKDPLKSVDDPYRLPDFFPCPKPLVASPKTSSFLPVTDYHQAQDQYNELDVLYARMSLIVQAVKVAGAYDSSATEIGQMLQGQENKLIPVDNWAMYAEKGGAKGMIDWYPIEQIVTVFQALQSQYEAVKSMLYEVTGMSDIMRGQSNQYETAAAQQIKAQFASVRMNGYQRDTSEFVRDILRVMSGIMCSLYSDQKFQQICGSFSQEDQQYLQAAVRVLRNDIMRMYKVDIEADSLTQSDWALEKEQRAEVVGVISQFLTSALPAATQYPEMAPMLVAMLKFSLAGYKGAAEIEGIIDNALQALMAQAQNPPPKEPTPEEQKMELEKQKAELKSQSDQQKAALDAQKQQQEMAFKEREHQLQLVMAQQEMEHKREMAELDMRIKRMELMFKQQEQQMKLQGQAESTAMKIEAQEISNEQRAEADANRSKGSDST